MADQMIFKRCEIKYMLDITQAELLKNQMKQLQMRLSKANGEMVQIENQDFKLQDMITMQYKQLLMQN